jgi:hypothetical protein
MGIELSAKAESFSPANQRQEEFSEPIITSPNATQH